MTRIARLTKKTNAKTTRYSRKTRVIVIGGGFGGLAAAKSFKNKNVDVTLVDRRNHHLFQPLLYQVATGALGPAEIAVPLRHLLRKQKNVRVLMHDVVAITAADHSITFEDGTKAYYDKLIVACGSKYNYFGKDEWEKDAPSLKTLEDALEIRSRVLTAFEMAENDPKNAHEILNFVIIGGGPTGVELAGQVAELARKGMDKNFRHIDPKTAQVILLDVSEAILGPMGENLGKHGHRQLEELGVDIRLGQRVTDITDRAVVFGDTEIPTRTVIWAAGVAATGIAKTLADSVGEDVGPGGRVWTDKTCLVKGSESIYCIGDMAAMEDTPLPGLATVAMQEGRYVARRILGNTQDDFKYKDKGSLATIGRNRAVGKVGRFELHGFVAWFLWLFIHLGYLAGLQNRFVVVSRWVVNYITYGRAGRLITETGWQKAQSKTKAAKNLQ